MTGKIKRIEVLQGFAEKIADPKLKNLLTSGDLKQMRDIFGMEESMEEKADIMGTEYVYDARGIRFIKYKSGNTGLRFSELQRSSSLLQGRSMTAHYLAIRRDAWAGHRPPLQES